MKKINLIFFGRLEREKWFDLILDLIENYKNSNFFDFEICGDGKYKKDIKKMASKFDNVNYHWWVGKDKLNELLEKAHFSLMPSRFLETFGLTGLESLKKGVPVIGFGKGGCQKFIFQQLDILNYSKDSDIQGLVKMLEKIKKYDKSKLNNFSQDARQIANKFSKERWLKRFENIVGSAYENTKILMVSDFMMDIGGIEKYIFETKDLLEKQGYIVQTFGYNDSTDSMNRKDKVKGVIQWLFNRKYGQKLKEKINEFDPDIIWYHSILRFLGWKSINVAKSADIKKIMMYHDFGYFYPFPSKLSDISQIEKLSLFNFLKSAGTYNPVWLFLVFLKYVSIKLIKWQIKKDIDMNLVPSKFMEKVVKKQYDIDQDKIQTLPHYDF